jgi:hypothetical protein
MRARRVQHGASGRPTVLWAKEEHEHFRKSARLLSRHRVILDRDGRRRQELREILEREHADEEHFQVFQDNVVPPRRQGLDHKAHDRRNDDEADGKVDHLRHQRRGVRVVLEH